MCDKRLPAKVLHDHASCQDTRQEVELQGQSLQEAIFPIVLAGSKILRTVSAKARYDGQTQQEAKIGVLV